MVIGLAFLATAVATLFAQATLVRFTKDRRPQDLAWTISLAMFALASAALATGVSTGWDNGLFRIFFLLGAVLTVPWLALGTVYLLWGRERGRRVQWGLVFFSGLAAGVLFTAPIDGPLHGTAIPVGSEVFGVFPRVLAAVGSGVGAVVIIGGALWSAWRFARSRTTPGNGRRAAGEPAHRARHARALERRTDPGRRGQGRGIRHHARVRDRRDLHRIPRRRGRRRQRRATTASVGTPAPARS